MVQQQLFGFAVCCSDNMIACFAVVGGEPSSAGHAYTNLIDAAMKEKKKELESIWPSQGVGVNLGHHKELVTGRILFLKAPDTDSPSCPAKQNEVSSLEPTG
jgi:hypothetical protein